MRDKALHFGRSSFLSLFLICCCFPLFSWESIQFTWGKPSEAVNEIKLKEQWVSSLLQECIKVKLEKEFAALGLPYKIDQEIGILPSFFEGEILFVDGEYKIPLLVQLLQEGNMEFSEEFSDVLSFWQKWVYDQKQDCSHPLCLKKLQYTASFSYEDFLERSEEILQTLSLEDIESAFAVEQGMFLVHHLQSFDPYVKEHGRNRDMAMSTSSLNKGWESSSDSKVGAPKSEEAQAFFNLPLSDEDKVHIRKLINAIADKNVLQLLVDKKSIERRGDQVHHVHPMRFMGFILGDAHLRRCMKTIHKNSFKWNGFIEGYEKRMKEEAKAGNLNRFVPGLADYLEVDRNAIQYYISHKNYEGLVKHFL